MDGIHRKKAELEKLLEDKRIEVALLQETRLTKNFHVIRADRTSGRHQHNDNINIGGGVAVLIRNGLSYHRLPTPFKANNDATTEGLFIQVTKDNLPVNILNLYVPPIRHSTNDDRHENFDPKQLPWKSEQSMANHGVTVLPLLGTEVKSRTTTGDNSRH